MENTTINSIRKCKDGEIEIIYTEWHEKRTYTRFLVIPKNKIVDLKMAMNKED